MASPSSAIPAKSPWGKPSTSVQACSLEDVMSEQLASELQSKENAILQDLEQTKTSEAAAPISSENGASMSNADQLTDAQLAAKLSVDEEMGCDVNDEVIARMLQKEFDKEFDSALSKREQFFNGNSKVSISYDNYKRKNLRKELYENGELDDDDDDDDELDRVDGPENYPEKMAWDKGTSTIGARGYSGQGKNIVTKHDKVICERRNAQKLMQFHPNFVSGDGEGMDMQLPNKVFNNLKRHSDAENRKRDKVHEKKDHSTAIKAVDEKTRILIFKMINSEFLTSVDGVVSEGKEAVVFKAIGGRKDDVELPRDVILKIYKTSLNEFKTRLKYIHGDYRLSKDLFRKFNARKLMTIWAEKEFANLKKMARHGVPCPSALTLKKQILAMTCIGGEKPAPKLRDVIFHSGEIQDAYEQTVDLLKNIYHKCNMVHADFSPYNLLWHDKKVWVIDVGQAVDRENKNSTAFLLRDCKNTCDFFKEAGAANVPNPEGLFNEITGQSLQGEGLVFESHSDRFEKEKYAFDHFFELAESSQMKNEDHSSDSDSDEDEYIDEDEEVIENDK